MVTAHFNHVEIRHAGQAFRIGRYPIHFHISGDVDGSYVKGCSIHHSFNRAVTMHGINNLLVERNVFYNAKGNAFFMEDGIEIGNVIQYNLGIFVTSSTSTLNVDVTPASYWVTNANNTVRHNVAAGNWNFLLKVFIHCYLATLHLQRCVSPRTSHMARPSHMSRTSHMLSVDNESSLHCRTVSPNSLYQLSMWEET